MSEKPTVEQLLRRWVELRKQGLKSRIEDLCTDCPELAGPLGERIEQLGLSDLGGPLGTSPAEAPAGPDQTTASTPTVQINGYTILREIGHGGQGVIFKALQHSTGRHVAVKILTETRQLSDIERARFDREAQVLAALEHPHIISILDRGHTAAGSSYFAMEYIEGRPLDRWLQEYRRDHPPADIPSNPGEMLHLFMKIADAVNVAHLRGIIHRDLKPSNILVDDAGNPHILDFGLARLGLPAEVYSEQHRIVTMTGQFIGTLPWVSPEQAEGLTSKVDTRTDVYSLGVILYEMLTAEFPYDVVGNMRDVLDNILRAQPKPPSTVIEAKLAKQAQKARRWRRTPQNPITPGLEAIVLKALNKRPEDRYQNAGELARDIGSYLSGRPTLAAEVRPRSSHRRIAWAAAAGAVLVLIMISVAVWISGWPHKSDAPHALPGSLVAAPESPSASFMPDPNLRAAVIAALGLKDRDPTPEDVRKLTRLGASARGVRDLTGLEHGTNLISLMLDNNRIADLAPLANVQKLTYLWVMKNQVEDVSPLGRLSSLQVLVASNNQIRDISPLSGLSSLKELSVDVNPLGGGIAPLAGLAKLTLLHVTGNGITDISALRGLTSLEDLWLSGNDITDLSPLLSHARLRVLRLDGNPLGPMAVDKQIPAIRANNRAIDLSFGAPERPTAWRIPDPNLAAAIKETLGLKDRDPTPEDLRQLAKLDVSVQGVRDLTGLEHATNLTSLMLNNNQIADLTPLANMQKLTYLWVMKNHVEDVSPLGRLSSLRVLVVSNNQIRDISPLSRLSNLKELSVDVNPLGGRISPVAGLVKLTLLHVTGAGITDISALGRLTALEDLWLHGNRIADLSALLSHTRLRVLKLGNNPLSATALERQIPAIRANNPTVDISLSISVSPQ